MCFEVKKLQTHNTVSEVSSPQCYVWILYMCSEGSERKNSEERKRKNSEGLGAKGRIWGVWMQFCPTPAVERLAQALGRVTWQDGDESQAEKPP